MKTDFIQSEEKKKKKDESEDSFRILWGKIMWTNFHIAGVPEEEREKGG